MDVQTVLENPTSFQNFENQQVVQTVNIREDVISSSALQNHFLVNLSQLTDSLILTSASTLSPSILQALNINCIINVAPELPDPPNHDHIDMIYHKIPVIDSGSSRILPYFDEAADLIHKVSCSSGRTLVYCVAGVSRSASICIAYLMKYHQFSLLDSYNYVKIRRPRIKPNCGFFKQLIEYEKQLFDSNTVRMVFNEFVRMEIPDVYDSEYRLITNITKKRRLSTKS